MRYDTWKLPAGPTDLEWQPQLRRNVHSIWLADEHKAIGAVQPAPLPTSGAFLSSLWPKPAVRRIVEILVEARSRLSSFLLLVFLVLVLLLPIILISFLLHLLLQVRRFQHSALYSSSALNLTSKWATCTSKAMRHASASVAASCPVFTSLLFLKGSSTQNKNVPHEGNRGTREIHKATTQQS